MLKFVLSKQNRVLVNVGFWLWGGRISDFETNNKFKNIKQI